MTAYRELIERLDARAKEADDWCDRMPLGSLVAHCGDKEEADASLLRAAANALRALEAQSKDKEEGE